MVTICKFNNKFSNDWDNFVKRSKNATFLFYRNYMDYHADRFKDHSLLFFENDKIIALFPANIKENILYSHGGLTYGGFLLDDNIYSSKVLQIFDKLINYLKENSIVEVIYKTIPHIYHQTPAEEDLYALFRYKALLLKRELSSAIYLPKIRVPSNRKNGYNRATKNGITLVISEDFDLFFDIAKVRLNEKYNLTPVHSGSEMLMLAKNFPENIKLYFACLNDEILGGAIMYVNKLTAHAQYLASTETGRELRIMDFILISLLNQIYKDFLWFDFGISTENNGLYLNESLAKQKEEFGASALCYDTYKVKV